MSEFWHWVGGGAEGRVGRGGGVLRWRERGGGGGELGLFYHVGFIS